MSKEITIQKKVDPIVKKADDLEIKTPKHMEAATEMLSQLNKMGDNVEAEKMKVMRPLLDAQKAERGRWKPIETKLEEAIAIVRRKMTIYQTAAKKEADEEAARIAARVGEGKGKLKIETAIEKIADIKTPAASVATDAGMVKFRTDKKFEVMDITMLPTEYLLANETKIREAMKAGTELPGVRYYTEEVPVNSR